MYNYNYTSFNISYHSFNESNQSDITYLIKLVNTGETLLKNFIVIDILPKGLDYVNSSDKPENFTSFNGKTAVTWNISSLNTNQEKNIRFNARRADNITSISASDIHAEVQALGKILSCENGTCKNKRYPKKTAEKEVQGSPAVQAKKMLMNIDRYYKGPGKDPSVGRKAKFILEIKNTGKTKLNISATDILPDSMKFVSCKCIRANSTDEKGNPISTDESNRCNKPIMMARKGGTNVTWNLGELMTNETFRLEIVTNFEGEASQAINNKAYVEGEFQGKKIGLTAETIDSRR